MSAAMNWDAFKKMLVDGISAVGTAFTGAITTTGDLAAAGGFRRAVGPFTAPGAAGVIAASQTNLDMRHSHTVTAVATGWVAPRAGSIMGLTIQLSAAIEGATSSLSVSVTKNGTEVACAVVVTTAGAEVKGATLVAKDTLTFAAQDVIGVSYTSDAALSNTPALVASVEVEC